MSRLCVPTANGGLGRGAAGTSRAASSQRNEGGETLAEDGKDRHMNRVKGTIFTRLERLESRANAVRHRHKSRMGHLKRLPPEYKGERHIVVAKQLPNIGDQEWVEYEERAGPEPPQDRNGSPEHGDTIDIVFVPPYPRTEAV